MLFKCLGVRGKPIHGGTGCWPLPKRSTRGWVPGEWLEVTGDLRPCANGLHLCTADQLLDWVAPRVYVAEFAPGSQVMQGHMTLVGEKARLLRPLESWRGPTLRRFGLACVKRIESILDHDGRKAIELVEDHLHGERSSLTAAVKAAKRAVRNARSRDKTFKYAAQAVYVLTFETEWRAIDSIARLVMLAVGQHAADALAGETDTDWNMINNPLAWAEARWQREMLVEMLGINELEECIEEGVMTNDKPPVEMGYESWAAVEEALSVPPKDDPIAQVFSSMTARDVMQLEDTKGRCTDD